MVNILKQNLFNQYENYCNFSNETKERSISVREISWYPFCKLKELYQIFCGIIISHETVQKAQIITKDLYYLNQEIKPSCFYGYDVQWEPLDDGYHYRHLLFDLVNNAPVTELLAPDEDLKKTYDFINKSVKPNDRKAIVTDLKLGYDSVMKKLGFKNQHCIYHLRLVINESEVINISNGDIVSLSILNQYDEKVHPMIRLRLYSDISLLQKIMPKMHCINISLELKE